MIDAKEYPAGTLPTGTLTFLFTDLEGSTRLWESYPAEMKAAMARHDELFESVVAAQGGTVVRPRGEGDSRFAVFTMATDAIGAAAGVQLAFWQESWPVPQPMRVRIALHTGEAEARGGDYYGSAVNRCARLRALAHGGQTLLSQATYSLVNDALPEGVSLRDLGEQELRDFKRPERVYELVIAGVPADFPPLKAAGRSLKNSPISLTSFIGRKREIEQVRQLLGEKRLLTVVGPGGSGKTRLAMQLATELVETFKAGGWFVDLTTLANPVLVDPYVMSALGIREESCCPPLETLQSFLQDKSVLLVLDNCEHVLAGISPLAQALLAAAHGLKILATSREPLGIAGETLWTIPPLSTPASDEQNDVASLLRYEAIQLFVERAAAVKPGFALSANNAHAVWQISTRLDGIPLAVELAAARIKILSPADIAARLDDRFHLLVSSQNVIPRQRTLRNLIDWSYDLLPSNEQELLRILSLFAGGWTLEAAEAVSAGASFGRYEVLDLLSRLVDKSLVIVETKESGERFRFLETIRQYARDRLSECGQVEPFSRNHASYCMELAEQSYGESWGRNQRRWLERLEAEHDNLRAALEWMKQHDSDGDLMLRMAGSLWHFWRIYGHLSEGRAWLEYALTHSPNASKYLRANGLRGAGKLAVQQGDYPQALTMSQESLALFREMDDRLGISRQLDVLGEIARHQGDYGRASQLHQESLSIGREIGDKEGIAASLQQLGVIARDHGDYRQAREHLEESLKLFHELEDKIYIANTLISLGLVEHQMSDYGRANQLIQEAVSLYRDLNDKVGIANGLQNLGNVARDQGELKQARSVYEECLELRKELGDQRGIALAMVNTSEAAFYQGNYQLAVALAEKGLAIFEELGIKRGTCYAKTMKGYAAVYQGDYETAGILAEESLTLSIALNSPRAIAYVRQLMGLLSYARGDVVAARQQFQIAYETFLGVENQVNVAGSLVNLARAEYRLGYHEDAQQHLEESLALSRRLKSRWFASYALEIMGLLQRRQGNHEQALALFCESLSISIDQDNLQGIANCLGALAGLALARAQQERAVRFFAAADKARMSVGARMGQDDQLEYEHYLQQLRQGVDENTFETLWSEGGSMPLAEVCQDAWDWHTGLAGVPAPLAA